jgi:hypothetical protein
VIIYLEKMDESNPNNTISDHSLVSRMKGLQLLWIESMDGRSTIERKIQTINKLGYTVLKCKVFYTIPVISLLPFIFWINRELCQVGESLPGF